MSETEEEIRLAAVKGEAIELMSQAVNVDDWNQRRDMVKSSCPGGKLTPELLTLIDGSGLIKRVLI